nr:zinc finger, CCHC-type, retrotransposon Gag domain protein [Tanacetum cinerariifolium]
NTTPPHHLHLHNPTRSTITTNSLHRCLRQPPPNHQHYLAANPLPPPSRHLDTIPCCQLLPLYHEPPPQPPRGVRLAYKYRKRGVCLRWSAATKGGLGCYNLWYQELQVNHDEAMINAAVANALPNLMAALRTHITNNIRNGAGPSGSGGEDWITHMEMLFQVLGCPNNFKTRLAAFKLEGDALSWWKAHLRTQLDRENSGEYMERFTRLASFVRAAARDAQRQARHFKWGIKKWVLDRIVNTDYTNVSHVAAAARNIELLHESGNSNKRDRDGNWVQNRGQGQQEIRGRYDQGQHVYRGRQD